MEFYAKNSMKQVEYCYEGFDNKTLFLDISFTLIQTQFFTVILYWEGIMGGFFSRF